MWRIVGYFLSLSILWFTSCHYNKDNALETNETREALFITIDSSKISLDSLRSKLKEDGFGVVGGRIIIDSNFNYNESFITKTKIDFSLMDSLLSFFKKENDVIPIDCIGESYNAILITNNNRPEWAANIFLNCDQALILDKESNKKIGVEIRTKELIRYLNKKKINYFEEYKGPIKKFIPPTIDKN